MIVSKEREKRRQEMKRTEKKIGSEENRKEDRK